MTNTATEYPGLVYSDGYYRDVEAERRHDDPINAAPDSEWTDDVPSQDLCARNGWWSCTAFSPCIGRWTLAKVRS